MITIGEALALGKAALEPESESARFDSEVLLCHLLKVNKAYLIAWPERELSLDAMDTFVDLLDKRKQGTPIAYLLGEREFWSLDLNITSDVLIPRPNTELLVEMALELSNQFDDEQNNPSELKVADLGTGSGAIALALAHEKPKWDITATDLCPQALRVAQGNANSLEIDNIMFRQGKWFEALNQNNYHLIISNPPYIRNDDSHLKQGDLRFEPMKALSSGESGLDDLTDIINSARNHLVEGGWLLLEHGYDQHQDVQTLLSDAGFTHIETQHDLAGIPRVTMGQNSDIAPTEQMVAPQEIEDTFGFPPLDDVQIRILGSLIEKSLTAPDHYPLTIDSLQAACSQKAGRRPVMQIDISTIENGISSLVELQLARISTDPQGTPHFRHRLESTAGFNKAQIILLSILFLRGDHTATDLLQRTEHLFTFANPQHIEKTLLTLANHDDFPCVLKLERTSSNQESYWTHTLSSENALPYSQPDLVNETEQPSEAEKQYLRELEHRVSELEDIITELSPEHLKKS